MSREYTYDEGKAGFRVVRDSVWKWCRRFFAFILVTMSLAVVYYILFALVFSTETERRLKLENELYEQEMPSLERKEKMLADVIDGLKSSDNRIYEEIFHMAAPGMEPMSSVDFLAGLDSIPDDNIVRYAEAKISKLESSADRVTSNFERIMEVVHGDGFVMPPMTMPLKDFKFAQTGASVGDKINPFYKVSIRHNGLDMLARSGEPVYAVADAVVKDVVRSRKGLGNVVELDHGNGYVTRYAHLADIEVKKGRKVKKGTRIGYVGVSGNSFAPHLHYEVLKDTLILDPINHFFSSVTPEEYMNMLVLSVSTGQSMD